MVGRVFGLRRGQEPLQCGHCHAERDPRDLFCGRCGEDFTGTGTLHVLEPDPPGGPDGPLAVLEFDPPGSAS